MKRAIIWIAGLAVAILLLAAGALVFRRLMQDGGATGGLRASSPVPVEIAPVEVGVIENRRVFSGALEATARVTIAPKVAGRIVSLPVDIADRVTRGQVVARLDSAEFEQSVAQADAELAVARASLVEAENALEIATREHDRVRTLHDRGVASSSQLDTARASSLAADANVQVARAQILRAEAALQAARIRLDYTTIRADWEEGDESRVVAERFAEEGDTVSASAPLLTIVELDPIDAVIYATERDYAMLAPGQPVTLSTDAFPQRIWSGEVARVAPVFREGSRQARVEVRVPNPEGALKPGMFVRVQTILGRDPDATIVPVEALAERDGRTVVFVVDPDHATARMTPVDVGIRDAGRVQVIGDGVRGAVVTLGQQLLGETSDITVPQSDTPPARTAADRAPEREG